MEKYIVWFDDMDEKFVDTIEEVLSFQNDKPIRVTCEMYDKNKYIGEYDITFDEFIKENKG